MNGGGLTKVTVTQEDGTVIEYTEKEDIERACLEENRIKFSQTENSPVMTGVLAEEIGYDGTSDVCKRILEGTYIPPPNTDEYTAAYIKELQRPPQVQQPPTAQIETSTFKD